MNIREIVILRKNLLELPDFCFFYGKLTTKLKK